MTTPFRGNPFQCPRCDVFYSSTMPEYDTAPALLTGCSHTMCKGCVLNGEMVLEWNGKTSYTVTCAVCSEDSQCDERPGVLMALIDVQASIEKKTNLAFVKGVDAQVHGRLNPRCYACRATYSESDDESPFLVPCGHAMCLKCVRDKKVVRTEESKALRKPEHPYRVQCRECLVVSYLSDTNRQDGVLLDVVRWLNMKKVEHLESLSQSVDQFSCADCGQMTPCERGYVCVSCSDEDERKRRELCAFCTCEAHRAHETKRLSPFEEPINVCYLEGRLVGETCSALFEEVDKYFTTVIDTIPSGLTYSEEAKIAKLLKEKANDYDRTMKKIVASGRVNIQMLEDTIADLKKAFPVPQEADGDSMYDEESQAETQRERSDNKEKKKGRVPDDRDSFNSTA